MKITVINAKDALAAVRADPSKVLTIVKKKDNTSYKGTQFYKANFKCGQQPVSNGWFAIEDIPITGAILPPGDPKVQYDSSRCNLQTRVSVAGDFGRFLQEFNATFVDQVTAAVANNTIVASKGKKIHPLIRDRLSELNKESPGGVIDDPIISFDVDFRPHPTPFWIEDLSGKPRTEFLEYLGTVEMDDPVTPGKKIQVVQSKPAVVFNSQTGVEEPVTANNLHLFIVPGSRIVKGRLWLASIASSQSWVSMPLCLSKVMIQRGTGQTQFSDEMDSMMASMAAASVAASTTPSIDTGAKKQPAGATSTIEAADLASIDAALEGIAGLND